MIIAAHLLELGHTPIIGVNAALPVVERADVADEYEAIMQISIAVISICEAIRRRESHLLSKLYRQFKSEGLEIYGVGLGSGKEVWLKAIEQDKRIWISVSTFQEFETPVTFDYAVTSLPANVLIDNSGKVIAKNLHGNDLCSIAEMDVLNSQI